MEQHLNLAEARTGPFPTCACVRGLCGVDTRRQERETSTNGSRHARTEYWNWRRWPLAVTSYTLKG